MALRSSSEAESIFEMSMTGIEVKPPLLPGVLCTLRQTWAQYEKSCNIIAVTILLAIQQ
jgi:hypothetical protein